jgi:hypothetical protein
MRVNCEFDSNEMDESDLQYEKHDEARISTLLGITIDVSADSKNVSDSNETDESDLQDEKRDKPRILVRCLIGGNA